MKPRNPKLVIAAFLTYILCFLIIWDKNDVRHSGTLLSVSVAVALLLGAVLYSIRKRFSESKKVRIIAGASLLLTYMVSGLMFRGLFFHVLFCMTVALTAMIASFFMDLEEL